MCFQSLTPTCVCVQQLYALTTLDVPMLTTVQGYFHLEVITLLHFVTSRLFPSFSILMLRRPPAAYTHAMSCLSPRTLHSTNLNKRNPFPPALSFLATFTPACVPLLPCISHH